MWSGGPGILGIGELTEDVATDRLVFNLPYVIFSG